MPVEITILSGVRQGQQLGLDATEFRAGDEPGCAVFFDPQGDPSARDRCVAFQLRDDGWYVWRVGGGEVFVNQEPLQGQTRVRSGDVIRLSELGPDFSFRMVGRTAAAAGRAAASAAVAAPKSSSTSPPAAASPAAAAAAGGPPAESNPQPAATQPTPLPRTSRPWPPAKAGDPGRWVPWVGAAVICLMLLVVTRSFLPTSLNVVVQAPPRETAEPRPPTLEGTAAGPQPLVEVPEKPPQPPSAAAEGAVFLIEVERFNRSWPFATACAVGENTLLTSAREALKLAEWRREGFRIWASDGSRRFKEEIQEFRVHRAFAALAAEPGDWIYFNLGLLVTKGRLPKIAPLAAPEEIGALKEGAAVTCLGFTHEGDKLTSEDHFEPQLTPGKVFVITAPADLPGRPQLLHIKAVKQPIPKNAFGSPILNAQGKVVGVYGEAAVAGEGQKPQPQDPLVKNLHYATVVSPELIRSWLEDREGKIWVPAGVPQDRPVKK